MKVALVTGSRHLALAFPVIQALDASDPDLLIEGGAPGADEFARSWARARGVACLTWPDQHWGGHLAGPERNARMVEVAAALKDAGWGVLVHAFPESDSRGTWSCVSKAKAAGLPVLIHQIEAAG